MGDISTRKVPFIVCFVGVFFGFLFFGILQEKITKGTYMDENGVPEKFSYTQALVLAMCATSGVLSAIVLWRDGYAMPKDRKVMSMYAICAISYLGSMFSSNKALQYVPYPTQVLGKSVKPIPVMLMGVLVNRRKYPLSKYLNVLLIVIGVAIFSFKPSMANTNGEFFSFGFGEFLLLTSLFLDGVTGSIQERMRELKNNSTFSMMFNMNTWATLYLIIGMLVSGEFFSFVSFCSRHPYVLLYLFGAGFFAAIGQVFIFLTVNLYGPLACSIVTTTRKFFTILCSVIIFGNPMSPIKWVGTMFVFLGLSLDSYLARKKDPPISSKA